MGPICVRSPALRKRPRLSLPGMLVESRRDTWRASVPRQRLLTGGKGTSPANQRVALAVPFDRGVHGRGRAFCGSQQTVSTEDSDRSGYGILCGEND